MEDRIAEILRTVRRIHLRTRLLVRRTLTGAYRSRFKGQGIDFESIREYQSGDEIRSVDWNVTARTGQLHVREFIEERELAVYLAVDVSASSLYGSGPANKRETAAEVAAVIAHSALANRDRAGLVLFAEENELTLPASRGSDHLQRIVREILSATPHQGGTRFGSLRDFFLRPALRRCLLCLITDGDGPDLGETLRVLRTRHDVLVLRIVDPMELTLPRVGRVILRDPETGGESLVNLSSQRTRNRLHNLLAEHHLRIESVLKDSGVPWQRLMCGEDYLPVLEKLMSAVPRSRSGRN